MTVLSGSFLFPRFNGRLDDIEDLIKGQGEDHHMVRVEIYHLLLRDPVDEAVIIAYAYDVLRVGRIECRKVVVTFQRPVGLGIDETVGDKRL